ncbi:GemA protein [Metarhizobium album]|uniref:GemA protein n=1 Tax=Metarhizobium album TaxID=2182425 RepID=A0A2U2DFQ9_9HYPH|nr:regulatory protein GemA [Rhizobium album]PWE52132.1 GemA protein [Rhizobium album]
MTSSIAAIHVAKKQLGLDDDTYRAKLVLITGKASTKEMTEGERQEVLTELRRDGFQPKSTARRPDGRQKLTGKFAGKLQALWIGAYNLGIVPDRDDAALIGFVRRQTHIDQVRWLHHGEDANKVIEALKARMARDGGVNWAPDTTSVPWRSSHGYRIAIAQWRIINPLAPGDFWPVVTDLLRQGGAYRDVTQAEWIKVMNYFGERIRREKAGA